MGDRVRGSTPGARNLSQYITGHPGQLSLTIPPWVGAMGTSQRAVMLSGWGVKADMVRVWVAPWQVKLCDPLSNSGHI